MNTDIRVLISFRGHRKRRRLERIIGPGAAGHLIDLWIVAAIDRPEGILTDWDAEDIAAAANWTGEADEFVEALIKTGWLDRLEEATYALHNWQQRQGWVSGSEGRSNRNRINALIKHHGRKQGLKIAARKYGLNPDEYGFDADSATGMPGASAPSPSPLPSPSPEDDFSSEKSAAEGGCPSPKQPKKHCSESAGEYAKQIVAFCGRSIGSQGRTAKSSTVTSGRKAG